MNALHDMVSEHKTIVCVGSGGVGKTTTSAVLALHAALHGRKTLVLTIDPAKRLANSLGISDLGQRAKSIDLRSMRPSNPVEPGELWAMMLDMKSAFDEIVKRNADSEETVRRIVTNPFYHYFSTSLAGAQEYSAVESLAEIVQEGHYDLIVLDTPPARHAYDFLGAPDRLFEALDNSVLQWFYKPVAAGGKAGLGLFRLGTRYIRRTLGKFTGGTLLKDMGIFIESTVPMLGGVKERAAKVRDILHHPSTVFLVVTSPDPLTIEEALQMDRRLREVGVKLGGFVVNRVHRPILRENEALPGPEFLTEELLSAPGAGYIGQARLTRIARNMLRNAEDFGGLARIDAKMIERIDSEGQAPVFPIPFFSRDIYSLQGLERVRAALFDEQVVECARFDALKAS